MVRTSKWLVVALLWIGCAVALTAQQARPALNNDDVIKMVKGGLSDATILHAMASAETRFDVSVDALLALKQAGVSDTLIDAMLSAEQKKKTPPLAAAVPSPEQTPAAEAPASNAPSDPMSQQMAQMGFTPDMMARMPAQARQQIMSQISKMSPQQRQQMMSMMSSGGMSGGAMPFGGMSGAGAMGMGGSMNIGSPMGVLPKITLLAGANHKLMGSSMAQMAESKTKGGGGPSAGGTMLKSFATQGLSFAALTAGGMFAGPAMGIVSGLMGGFGHHGMPTTTYIWALPGRNSSYAMPTTTPKFDLEFGEIVGLDPDAFEPVLVQLVQTSDNYRLVGATKSKMDYSGTSSPQNMIDEERVKVKTTGLGRGRVQIEAASPLPVGEYAVVVRPTKANKPKKGESQSDAEQAVFYSVWDFSVTDKPVAIAPAPAITEKTPQPATQLEKKKTTSY